MWAKCEGIIETEKIGLYKTKLNNCCLKMLVVNDIIYVNTGA